MPQEKLLPPKRGKPQWGAGAVRLAVLMFDGRTRPRRSLWGLGEMILGAAGPELSLRGLMPRKRRCQYGRALEARSLGIDLVKACQLR